MSRILCCVGFVALGIFLGVACAPGTCGSAESHCVDAHTLESCGGSVDAVGQSRHSTTTTCTGSTPYCVDTSSNGETRGACAASATKARECVAAPNGQLCIGGQPARCANGYLFTLPPCAAGQVCVVGPTSGYALCALTATPDPSCGRGGAGDHCDGNTAVSCYDGYLVAKNACAGLCRPGLGECDSVVDAGRD